MIRKLSLRVRLIILFVGLVLCSVLLIGSLSVYQFTSFGRFARSATHDALTRQATDLLQAGVEFDHQTVRTLLDATATDALRLSTSATTKGYFAAQTGSNQTLNRLIEKQAITAVEGLVTLCNIQADQISRKLDKALQIASYILSSRGGFDRTALRYIRHIPHPDTGASQAVVLPVLQFGFDQIGGNSAGEAPTGLVDHIGHLTGLTCILFQDMNEAGDMIAVLRAANAADGSRDIDFTIPAVMPDGSIHPGIAAVQRGDRYRGRTRMNGTWWHGAFLPVQDEESGDRVGMLFIGEEERENETIKSAILNTAIGENGYAAVMNTAGELIVHPRAELVGADVVADLHIPEFQTVLDQYRSRETGVISYQFEGQHKFLSYQYFPRWDWIVLGIGYWKEFTRAETARALLKDEMLSLFAASVKEVDGTPVPFYRRLFCLGLEGTGMDGMVFQNGEVSTQPLSVDDLLGAEAIATLKNDRHAFSGVVQSPAGDVMRVAAPVTLEGEMVGAAVIEMNWELIWGLLKDRVYGETGYAYIINEKGVLVSHPRYRIADDINLSAPEYGTLAELTQNRMQKGETGSAVYTFEGVEKYVFFMPLAVGDKPYTIAVTSPVNEFFRLNEAIAQKAEDHLKTGLSVLALSAFLLIGSGILLAFIVARMVVRPLSVVITGLVRSAQQIVQAASELNGASQELAEGASEQAASLEETSATLEEMSASTRQNADNARETNELMQTGRSVVDKAGDSVAHLMKTMNTISAAGNETTRIIRNSDEIAFQTRLLALNAAVEAARAGRAGAGFGVVAGEVGGLAGRAKDASRSAASLLEGILDQLSLSVRQTEETRKAFDDIISSTETVSHLVEEIAVASREQARSIEQLNIAVSEVDKVTQRNAATAEEASAAAGEMQFQADRMKQYVHDLGRLVHGDRKGIRNAANGNSSKLRALPFPKR